MDTKLSSFDWEGLYRTQARESLPWYWPELDSDFAAALARLKLDRGYVLDLGTGPGTQAIALARRGFEVVGTDVSETAVFDAAAAARAAGVSVLFGQDDILDTKLVKIFDVVFDRGCFHVLPPERRADYAATLHRLTKPGGYFLLKTFSRREPEGEGGEGPHRFSPAEIEAVFAPHFEVCSIEESRFEGTRSPAPAALFAVLRRA